MIGAVLVCVPLALGITVVIIKACMKARTRRARMNGTDKSEDNSADDGSKTRLSAGCGEFPVVCISLS